MTRITRLIRFEADEDSKVYYADMTGPEPDAGDRVKAFSSFQDLEREHQPKFVKVKKLLAPLPNPTLPIYCVGLNYRSHAKEAGLNCGQYPPLWTKPAASLADPNENIPINAFCAQSYPDWEGELVFVTSKECRDLTAEEAKKYILGYTIGNDLSCRKFQMPNMAGGQFFYAKAFDKFAPIGPYLVDSEDFWGRVTHLTTTVNGEVVQDVEIDKDMIFTPAEILSHMSQGTTIPAYTAVMTGTPAGVGLFRDPKQFLKDNDTVEVSIEGIGTLRNKIIVQ